MTFRRGLVLAALIVFIIAALPLSFPVIVGVNLIAVGLALFTGSFL